MKIKKVFLSRKRNQECQITLLFQQKKMILTKLLISMQDKCFENDKIKSNNRTCNG